MATESEPSRTAAVGANVADLVRDAARARPDRAALVAGDRAVTWAAVDVLVDAVSAALLARGLSPGDRVAALLGNGIDFVVAYFGVLRAGLVLVPLNPAFTEAEVAALVTDSGARLVLCQAGTEAVTRDAVAEVDGCDVLVAGSPEWESFVQAGRQADAVTPAPGGPSLAVLLYTAGTSGRPKGAMLTHGALRANIESLLALDDPPAATGEDVVLVVLPLFHIYGLNAVLGPAAAVGATCVLFDRFDPRETLAAVVRHGVTTVAGAPPMYRAWVAQDGVREALSGVRLMTSGGAPLPPDLFTRVLDVTGQPVWEGYGLTETAPVVATTMASHRPRPGSVGRPVPGVEVRLVDGGDDVDEGDPGEVWVRAASVFAGYWPDGAGGADADGWFSTGDVAYADDDGDLHLVDRRREVVLVSGFNVYPREVELVIDAIPDVVECAVVGVPDERTGEAVKAFVVARPGSDLTGEQVSAHCATRLARFKCPATVVLVEALPHSATGKVAKGRLREVHGE